MHVCGGVMNLYAHVQRSEKSISYSVYHPHHILLGLSLPEPGTRLVASKHQPFPCLCCTRSRVTGAHSHSADTATVLDKLLAQVLPS